MKLAICGTFDVRNLGDLLFPLIARHENHRHHNCDEFFIVLKGHGTIYTDSGEKPSGEGDVVYSPRGCWHGFNNTSGEDVVLVWGWMGAGSIEASGYEVHPEQHQS